MLINDNFLTLVFKVLLLLFLGWTSGIFSFFNNYIYDHTYNLLPYPSSAHNDFILIDALGINSSDMNKLIDRIYLQNPKVLIADIFHNHTFSNDEVETLIKANPDVLFPLPVFISDVNKVEYFNEVLEKNLDVFSKYSDQIGLYNLNALYEKRLYQTVPVVEYKDFLSLFPSIDEDRMFANYFNVNYNGNPPFAKIYAKDILEKNITLDLFIDKIIILSNIDNNYMMPSSYFKDDQYFIHQSHLAFVLKSFIYDESIFEFTTWQYILFSIIFTLVWLTLLLLFFYRYLRYLFIFAAIIPTVLYIILLSFTLVTLPVTEMIFISTVVTYMLLHHWKMLQEKKESQLAKRLSMRVKEKKLDKTFFNSERYWMDVLTVINQLIPSNKIIIFEKLAHDTRINEIVSYNCTFEEIREARRDYTREPYASAIKNKMAVIPHHQFFSTTDLNTEEFVVPLVYESDVIGMLAISIEEPDDYYGIQDIQRLLENLCKELSQLLHARMEYTKRKIEKGPFSNLINMVMPDDYILESNNNYTIIEKRMLLHEIIFDKVPSQFIAYNHFGEIIQINNKMQNLLEEENVSVYSLNASEMLHNLTEISLIRAKEIIREVTINVMEHRQFIYCRSSHKKLLLTISSLSKNDVDNKFTENYLFDTCGLVFIFQDLDFIEKRYNLRQDIIDISLNKTKTSINELERTIDGLEKSISTSTEKNLFNTVKEQIHDIDFSHHKLHLLMQQDLDNLKDDLYPLDIMKSIELSCDYVVKKYNEKQIGFNIKSPDTLPLVLASVSNINKYLEVLLSFLAEDCEENGIIDILLKSKDDYINISFHSYGYGMPNEKLMSYIMDAHTTNKYRMLHNISRDILLWNGDIYFSSYLGEGISIKLALKKVTF